MQDRYQNIYFNARKAAGFTQESWAELLGLSAEAVRQYETGRFLPSDDVAMRMAEGSGKLILAYWHMRHKSTVAKAALPEVPELPLAQAAIQLLNAMQRFNDTHSMAGLLSISEDGRVSEGESARFAQIVKDLQGVVKAAMAVQYAQRGEL